MTTWWPYARLAAAVLALGAIFTQFSVTINNALAATTPWGSHLPTVMVNFFSFFTILSNLLASVTLIIAGLWGLRRSTRGVPATSGAAIEQDAASDLSALSAVPMQDRAPDLGLEPRWLATLLICASTYMIVTGVVYNLLLRGVALPQGTTVPWSNEVLHVVFPLFLLLDVLIAPRRRALPWNAVLVAAIFPVVWAAYTLLRANLITAPATGNPWWYPYPFLDPHQQPAGYLSVVGYIVLIAGIIIGVAALVVWIGRRRGARLETAVVA